MGASARTAYKFDQVKRARFLELYAQGGPVRQAAEAVGVTAVTVFNTARSDEKFAKLFKAAMEVNLDMLEDRLHEHACFRGTPGNISALFGILNAKRAAVWRQNSKLEVTGAVTMVTADLMATARKRVSESEALH